MSQISVIVPVYKAEKYIHRCVDSILAQTFFDFVLILIDDGSPDRCGAICDEYAKKDSRIQVIHQENRGQAAARNRGVSVAKTPWICFVDSDDMIHPQLLEHLYRAAAEQGTAISMCGVHEGKDAPPEFADPQPYAFCRQELDEAGLEALYTGGSHRYWVPWAKLIRKELLEKLPFTPGRVYEDNAVVFRWLHEAGAAANSTQKYYFYQTNPDSTTNGAFSAKRLDFLWALRQQIDYYGSVGYARMEREAAAYYLKAGSWYLPKVCDILGDRKIAAGLRRDMRKMMRRYPLEGLPLSEAERAHIIAVTPSPVRRALRKGKALFAGR